MVLRAIQSVGLILCAVVLAGCQPSAQPTLVSARFLDEVKTDGQPQEHESIVLVFSDPVRLENEPAKAGLELTHDGDLGVYEIRNGDRPNELRVVIGRGSSFEARGRYGSSEHELAGGISVDFDRVSGLESARGHHLRGRSPTIDIGVAVHDPPVLVSCHWIDGDKSYSVSPPDTLRLTFDREVQLPPETKKTGAAPSDLFYLPVDGDILGDQTRPPRMVQIPAGTSTVDIVLGNHPQLRLEGEFASLQPGAPSGIAINGTRIRPHPGIVGMFGRGVMSDRIIDIEGECEPFRDTVGGTPLTAQLYQHTATTLPEGRVLVAGGFVPGSAGREPTSDAWLYDPETESWSSAGRLSQPRYGHTATYFPGPDGDEGTLDDFVLIHGGFDKLKPTERSEVFLPNADVPEFLPVTHDPGAASSPRSRYAHTAHRVPETEQLIVVGGFGESSELEPRIEQLTIDVQVKSNREILFRVDSVVVGQLHTARVEHAAVLIDGENLNLFVFGGVGVETAKYTSHQILGDRAPISAPELVVLNENAPESGQPLEAPKGMALDAERRGHQLVRLPEERWPYLLVGGTKRKWPGQQATIECRTVYRIELDTASTPPRIGYKPCGELDGERYYLGAAVLENGNVLIAGGRDVDDATSDRVLLFNVRTNTLENFCHPMLAPRENFRIVPLLTGEWLMVGGSPSGAPATEVFRGVPY